MRSGPGIVVTDIVVCSNDPLHRTGSADLTMEPIVNGTRPRVDGPPVPLHVQWTCDGPATTK